LRHKEVQRRKKASHVEAMEFTSIPKLITMYIIVGKRNFGFGGEYVTIGCRCNRPCAYYMKEQE
jgi:hypothetical protein